MLVEQGICVKINAKIIICEQRKVVSISQSTAFAVFGHGPHCHKRNVLFFPIDKARSLVPVKVGKVSGLIGNV